MIRNNKSKRKFNKTNKFKDYKIWRVLICQKHRYFIGYLCKYFNKKWQMKWTNIQSSILYNNLWVIIVIRELGL